MTFPGVKDGRQRADLLAFLKDATRPGPRPSVAAQGGGMMGMMGGGQVPICRSSMPRIGCSRSIIAGTPTTSPPRREGPRFLGAEFALQDQCQQRRPTKGAPALVGAGMMAIAPT